MCNGDDGACSDSVMVVVVLVVMVVAMIMVVMVVVGILIMNIEMKPKFANFIANSLFLGLLIEHY